MFEALLIGGTKPPPFDLLTEPLLAGTATNGWYGEVSPDRFITGGALATAVGLGTNNTLAGRVASPWLHFSLAGKRLLVAKTPFKSNLSRNTLNGFGIVAGTKTITIGAYTFKVRMLTGAAAGEWDKLMYKVSASDPTATFWARYTDAQLGLESISGMGGQTICMDSISGVYPIVRGGSSTGTGALVTRADSTDAGVQNAYQCWRPVLEYVP